MRPDHWLYKEHGEQPEAIFDPPQTRLWNEVMVRLRWALQAATENGTKQDFDPDGFILDACNAICGECCGGHLTVKGDTA